MSTGTAQSWPTKWETISAQASTFGRKYKSTCIIALVSYQNSDRFYYVKCTDSESIYKGITKLFRWGAKKQYEGMVLQGNLQIFSQDSTYIGIKNLFQVVLGGVHVAALRGNNTKTLIYHSFNSRSLRPSELSVELFEFM